MAVIVLTDNDVYTIPEQALTSLMLLAVLVITYVLFLSSEKILLLIGRSGASILIRVMGIILAALSVELIMGALGIGVWAGVKH
jgi:multiple antibiotic resistance protein